MSKRKCEQCGITKKLSNEFFRACVKGEYFRHQCRKCDSEKTMKYKRANLIHVKSTQKKWKENNPYYMRNYKIINKEKIREYNRGYESQPLVRLRKNISRNVNRYIFRAGGSQFGSSIFNHLPYTAQELRDHLEANFETWMNWDNWGIYDVNTWNDHDSLTWTWQIDHIIPQSKFNYTSMEDINFAYCWALSNLRPFSAKQNIADGASKIRH